MKIKIFLLVVISILLIINFSSCFFKSGPSEIILVSPADDTDVFFEVIQFKWKLANHAFGVTYDFYLGNSIDDMQLIQSSISDEEYVANDLIKYKLYFWKVVGKNEYGESESQTNSFIILDEFPRNPSPANLSTDISTSTILSWECDCPEGSSQTYDVYLADSNTPYLVKEGCTEKYFDPGELFADTEYSWRIITADAEDKYEGEIWKFTTVPSLEIELPEPENPLPTINSTGILWNDITLKWGVSGNTDGLYYDIYFGKEKIPGIYRIGYNATQITIDNLERGQKYYWQIVVTDKEYSEELKGEITHEQLDEIALKRKDSAATIGDIWNFTTKENSAPVFVSISPQDNSDGIGIHEEISWNFTDPDGDEIIYDLYFENESNPRIYAGNIIENKYSPSMKTGMSYYWKIIAKDSYGGISETKIFNFSTNFIQWQKCLGGNNGDRGFSIEKTSDGGYILAGQTFSNDGDVSGNHGGRDFWIVKIDDSGALIWQKCFGGSDDDVPLSIIQTSDGGYIAAGYTYSNDGNVSGNHCTTGQYPDYWIIKLDKNGSLMWQKCYGGSNEDKAYSVIQTSDGKYVITGYAYSDDGDVSGNHDGADYWTIKIDDNGSLIWQKCYGGPYDDTANSILQTADEGYIIIGSTWSSVGQVSFSHGAADYWLVKIDKDGVFKWGKPLGGAKNDYASSIQITPDGGYIIAGESRSNDQDVSGNHGYADYWIVKVDGSGSIIWEKSLGGSDWDQALDVQLTSDGNYLVTGYSWSRDDDVSGNHGKGDYWIIKLDNTGSIISSHCFGGSETEWAYASVQSSSDSFVICGYTGSNDGEVIGKHGNNDFWIIKIGSLF